MSRLMHDSSDEHHWSGRLWWLAPFGIWSIPPLVLLVDAIHAARAERHAIDFARLAPYTSSCYVWAALTPAILYMGRRFRLGWPNPPVAILAHGTAIIVATTLTALVNTVVRRIVLPAEHALFFMQVHDSFRGMLPVGAIIYIGSLLASYSKTVTRKYQARETEAARLSAQLAEARLATLRMQLNPHFLFNSLNAIAGLVREHDNRTAVRVLAQLSDVLRHVLSTSSVSEVPLREELEFIAEYLDIERVRFPERLHVTWHVAAETKEALVPSLILQPVVENALKHGIHQRSARGHVHVEATRAGDVLRLMVRDDGRGFGSERPAGPFGVGLTNTSARLEQLYGSRGRLSLGNGPNGGAQVVIELPYRLASAEAASAAPYRGAIHV